MEGPRGAGGVVGVGGSVGGERRGEGVWRMGLKGVVVVVRVSVCVVVVGAAAAAAVASGRVGSGWASGSTCWVVWLKKRIAVVGVVFAAVVVVVGFGRTRRARGARSSRTERSSGLLMLGVRLICLEFVGSGVLRPSRRCRSDDLDLGGRGGRKFGGSNRVAGPGILGGVTEMC